jgi:hypothetical protein
MSIFNTINNLKNNILGGGGSGQTTAILRQSAIEMNDTSPTARLKKNPLAFSSYSYPKDLVNDVTNGHYMLFYINVQNKTKFGYTRADNGLAVEPTIVNQVYKETQEAGVYDTGTGKLIPGKTTRVATGDHSATGGNYVAGQPSPEYEQALIEKQSLLYGDVYELRQYKSKYRTGLAATEMMKNNTVRITDSVAIYLPPNVQDNYTTVYQGTPLGMIGFLAASAGGAMDAYRNDDFEGVARTILGTATGVTTEVLKNLGSSAIEALMSAEGGYELGNKIFGRAVNPYMEVLFSGPELRTFTYNFTFAPKSSEEQDEVKKIIHLFRFHQAPELRVDHNMFMGLPSEFDIHYMYQHEDGTSSKENDYYNKIATCVLQNVSVDYTPGGVKSHANGAPVLIKMSLTFLETEMITKDHIERGY